MDYCVQLIVNNNLHENCCNFTLKWFLLNSFGEVCFLEQNYKKMKKKIQIFKIWEYPLYEVTEYAFKNIQKYILHDLKLNINISTHPARSMQLDCK